MQVGNHSFRTSAIVGIAAASLALAVSTSGHAERDDAVRSYALAVSSGPGLALVARDAGTTIRQAGGQRLVCDIVIDVMVATIGRRCAAERDQAAALTVSK